MIVWFQNLSLRYKLLLVFLLVGLVPFGVLGYLATNDTTQALEKQVLAQLSAVHALKKVQITSYLDEVRTDMTVLTSVIGRLRDEALNKLAAVSALKVRQLEAYYIQRIKLMNDVKQNIRFTQGLPLFAEAFGRGMTSPEYMALIKERETGLRSFQQEFSFFDILFIDPQGNVVYSVGKESDLGQNVATGALRDSALGRVYAKARLDVAIEDFAFYQPSNSFASFIGVPLTNTETGALNGVVAFQIVPKDIDDVVNAHAGLGNKSGSFLVGRTTQGGGISLRSNRVVKQGKIGSPYDFPVAQAVLDEGEETVSAVTGPLYQNGLVVS